MAEIKLQEIKLRRRARLLEVSFDDGSRYALPCEYLRVHSPSAEVQGHGPGEGVLVVGKETVNIRAIEPVGHYAVRLVFDDGHDSGLYTWGYLHELGAQQQRKWADYLARRARAEHENAVTPAMTTSAKSNSKPPQKPPQRSP